ncbi:MAG: hypothetical protein AB2989_03945 [Candidatus Symbiodolus clandestinus]
MTVSENNKNLYRIINKFNRISQSCKEISDHEINSINNMIINLKVDDHMIKNDSKKTLLMWIAKLNNCTLIDKFFDYIYDKDNTILKQRDDLNNSAIKYAAIYNNTAFLRKAVSTDPEVLNEKAILKTAVLEGNIQFIRELIRLANDTINSEIEEAMEYATIKNYSEIYNELNTYNNELFSQLTFRGKNRSRIYLFSKLISGLLVKAVSKLFVQRTETYNGIEFLTQRDNRDIIYQFEIDNSAVYEDSVTSMRSMNRLLASPLINRPKLRNAINGMVSSADEESITRANTPDTNAFSTLEDYPSLGPSI